MVLKLYSSQWFLSSYHTSLEYNMLTPGRSQASLQGVWVGLNQRQTMLNHRLLGVGHRPRVHKKFHGIRLVVSRSACVCWENAGVWSFELFFVRPLAVPSVRKAPWYKKHNKRFILVGVNCGVHRYMCLRIGIYFYLVDHKLVWLN